ncbi:MAG: Multicopper oxidase [Edaphobacter sp.]|nr:Multicopper oxidase [Edaphobacter sp.]
MCGRLLPRFVLPVIGLLLGVTPVAHGAVQNRIVSAIDESSRVPIQHTVPARARLATDLGPTPAGQTLSTLALRFNMTSAQKAALTQLLVDLQNPSSPSYHQWLTPELFGARFGLSASDLAKVTGWLSSQGFTITRTARSSTSVTFTGTVAQVEQAFGTSIHALTIDGEQHIANLTDPVLPGAIAGIVSNITGLNDFGPKSRARTRTVNASEVRPQFTSPVSSNHFIAPGDFYTIYDVNPLLTNSINGSGITIAVVGRTDISLADVAAFRAASGLVAKAPTIKLYGPDPGTVAADLPEAQLDVEWSGAVAPSANILYVNSKDVINTSLANAIEDNLAPIMSISYGLCESAAGLAGLDSFNQLFQQANAQGITIVGPSGDSGATDCDYQSATASQGFAVDFPASSPFVTAAGGTMFSEGNATGATPYWSASNGTTSGSAISYIPETVWNETNSSGLGASGGGSSAFFSKPVWQIGNGVPADSSRDVPDISLNSASSHDGYLYCTGGSCVNGYRDSAGNLSVVGGTSVAAPTLAGIFALVQQKTGSRIGNANPIIYGLANSTYYNTVFHDVTTGNNNSPCDVGSPNCPNGGSIGYTANAGYDLATGWGSIDVFNFANTWALATPAGSGSTVGSLLSATTLSTSSSLCAVSSGSLALSVTVKNGTILSAGSATPPTPMGTVQFLVDNKPVGSPVALTSGTATYTLNTAALTSGGHNISATYSGDTTYSGSKGTLLASSGSIAPIDVVSSTLPDFSITPCAAPTAVRSGGTAPGVTFTLTPFNGFKGSIALSAVADSAVAASYSFSVTPVVINSTTGVTTSFVLTAFQQNSQTATGMVKLASNTPSSGRRPWYAAGSGAALACMMLLTLPRRRRLGALLAVVLSVAALTAVGCGGGTSSSGTPSPTTTTPAAPGTYNITVTGVASTSAGNVVHSALVTFTVQ